MIKGLKPLIAAAFMSLSLLSYAQLPSATCKPSDLTYKVDEWGYATYEYCGFTFKLKEEMLSTELGQKAASRMMGDLEWISRNIPMRMLNVMRGRAIWMEENNVHNRSAAWYHTSEDYPASIGDIAAKGKCLEITNMEKYVTQTAKNQPMMVFHELCHLYHDQALGSYGNKDIDSAYRKAKESGIYDVYYRRGDVKDTAGTETRYVADENNRCYCMNNSFEYFAEMSEAFWGQNDYYPYDRNQLKNVDPTAYELMLKIWE